MVFSPRLYARAGNSYGLMSVSVCLSLCLSVTSRCSIETAGRIELVFGMYASFKQYYIHCGVRKFRYLQK